MKKVFFLFAVLFSISALGQVNFEKIDNVQADSISGKEAWQYINNGLKSKEKKSGSLKAQTLIKEARYEREELLEGWYKFEIPQVINGSNISPLPVAFVSSDFSDSELSGQYGFSFSKTIEKDSVTGKDKKVPDFKTTGSIGASVAATDGIATLAKTDNSPVNWGLRFGVSQILYHSIHYDKTTKEGAENVNWLTLNFKWSRTPYNIFDTTATFDKVQQKIKTHTSSAIVSYNHYGYTTGSNRFFGRMIFSLGLGYIETNNYDQLDERVMQQVVQPVASNISGNSIRQVVETTSGAVGNFKDFKGMGYYLELYYPLNGYGPRGTVFAGARCSYYESGKTLNAVTGLYFNVKGEKADDVLNFSITGRFNSITNANRGGESKRNLCATSSLVLQVAVPIRFTSED